MAELKAAEVSAILKKQLAKFDSSLEVNETGTVLEVGDGIGGLIMSILLWIGMTILIFILLILLEAFFWVSIFIILAMLYWVFFRALRLVFSKSPKTKYISINLL